MQNNNKNELDKLFIDVVGLAIVKFIEDINYSLTHPTWLDKLVEKTLIILFFNIDKFTVTILKLLKEELNK